MDRCFAGAFLVAIMMVAFAIYIGWPCPSLSSNLLQWKNKDSSFFSIKKRKMFYKGELKTSKMCKRHIDINNSKPL